MANLKKFTKDMTAAEKKEFQRLVAQLSEKDKKKLAQFLTALSSLDETSQAAVIGTMEGWVQEQKPNGN